MEFVKKTALGYKPVDRNDSECSHIILDRAEYIKQQNLLAQERQYRELAEANVEKVQAESCERIQTAQNDAQKAIQDVRAALDAQKRETARQEALNANLRRICRERANADRDLRPKKQHTGYVVVASVEKSLRYKASRSMVEVMLWETTLQTPHSIELPEEQARHMLRSEIWQHLQKIGIEEQYLKGYEAMAKDPTWRSRQDNVLLQYRLKANYKVGYWELILQHTKPLGIVPADMRA